MRHTHSDMVFFDTSMGKHKPQLRCLQGQTTVFSIKTEEHDHAGNFFPMVRHPKDHTKETFMN